jgi:hypothetical protein
MHFQIQLTQEGQRYLSCFLGWTNSILILSYPIPSFVIDSNTTFITTQLPSSVWQSKSAQLHLVRNNIDLKSKDLVGVPLKTN